MPDSLGGETSRPRSLRLRELAKGMKGGTGRCRRGKARGTFDGCETFRHGDGWCGGGGEMDSGETSLGRERLGRCAASKKAAGFACKYRVYIRWGSAGLEILLMKYLSASNRIWRRRGRRRRIIRVYPGY